jgi:DNA helicase II / ATP-dependent DNA helicase PcrA
MSIGQDKALDDMGEDDFVLCRMNAPLVSKCFRLLRMGKKAVIVGRDIGQNLISLIKRLLGVQRDEQLNTIEVGLLIDALDVYQQQEIANLSRRGRPDEAALIALEDKVECIKALTEGVASCGDVVKNINLIFAGKSCPRCRKQFLEEQDFCWDCKCDLVKPVGTRLSSIHKAKGLEAKRVFILCPELLPHPRALSAWQMEQEMNLKYVAITRAIETLVWIL